MRIRSRLLLFQIVALIAAGLAVVPAAAAGSDFVVEGHDGSDSWIDSVSLADLVSGVPGVGAAGTLVTATGATCTDAGFVSEVVFSGTSGSVTVATTVLRNALGWPSADVLMVGLGSLDRPGCWSGGDPIFETRQVRVADIDVDDTSPGGDGDGFAECAETVSLGLTVSSVTETISNAQVVVGVLGTKASLVGVSSSTLADLQPGQEATAPVRFAVEIDDVVTTPDWITLVVIVGSADAVFESHRHIPIGCGLSGSSELTPQLVFPVAGVSHYEREWLTTHNPFIHEGVDIFASRMIPVVAMADGVVADVNWGQDPYHSGPSGCCAIAIVHDSGWESWYLHLNNDTPGTDDGDGWGVLPGIGYGTRVTAGQIIGFMGDSTNAEETAPHLHVELHDPAGNPIDPYDQLLASVTSGPMCVGQTDDVCFPFVIMSWNSRDQQVGTLQTLLGQAGFSPGIIDGSFGSLTDAAVRSFQGAAGLDSDGLVDEETWSELNRVVDEGIDLLPEIVARLGDRGAAVIEVQSLLASAGFAPGSVDGIFGSRTESAVRAFQADRSLPIDGRVDAATFDALDEPMVPSTILRLGDQGLVVTEIQTLLAEGGFSPGVIDGIFGSQTESAVRSFQSAVGLWADGIVGERTFEAMSDGAQRVVVARPGDRGAVVIEVQSLLAVAGFAPGPVDGIFGSLTERAVRAFQTRRGLPADGVVDEATLNALASSQ